MDWRKTLIQLFSSQIHPRTSKPITIATAPKKFKAIEAQKAVKNDNSLHHLGGIFAIQNGWDKGETSTSRAVTNFTIPKLATPQPVKNIAFVRATNDQDIERQFEEELQIADSFIFDFDESLDDELFGEGSKGKKKSELLDPEEKPSKPSTTQNLKPSTSHDLKRKSDTADSNNNNEEPQPKVRKVQENVDQAEEKNPKIGQSASFENAEPKQQPVEEEFTDQDFAKAEPEPSDKSESKKASPEFSAESESESEDETEKSETKECADESSSEVESQLDAATEGDDADNVSLCADSE